MRLWRRRPPPVVARFVDHYSAATGRSARHAMAEGIYQLTRVIDPGPVEGDWRTARDGDQALLGAWYSAFRPRRWPRYLPRRM